MNMNLLYKSLSIYAIKTTFAHKETAEKKKKRKHDMGKKATGWKQQQNTLECVLFAI